MEQRTEMFMFDKSHLDQGSSPFLLCMRFPQHHRLQLRDDLYHVIPNPEANCLLLVSKPRHHLMLLGSFFVIF